MKKWKALLAEQDIAPRYINCDFENHPAISHRWLEIVDYVKAPQGNIFMSGSCGNGKTLTAVAIFAFYISKYGAGARFFNTESLYPTWLNESRHGFPGDLALRLSRSPLLVLDDLGQGDISDSFKRWLYSIINRRWEFEQPIVCTTNLASPEFREVFGDAILSRLMDGRVWKFEGRDHRIPV